MERAMRLLRSVENAVGQIIAREGNDPKRPIRHLLQLLRVQK